MYVLFTTNTIIINTYVLYGLFCFFQVFLEDPLINDDNFRLDDKEEIR